MLHLAALVLTAAIVGDEVPDRAAQGDVVKPRGLPSDWVFGDLDEAPLRDVSEWSLQMLERLIGASALLTDDPERPTLYFKLGQLCWEKAAYLSRRAADPAGAKAWARRGIDAFTEAIRTAPEASQDRELAMLALALLQFFVGDPSRGLTTTERLSDAFPDAMRDPRIRLERGIGFAALGDLERAESELEIVARPGSPLRAYALYHLGWCQIERGKHARALQILAGVRLPADASLALRSELARSAAIASAELEPPAATIRRAKAMTPEPAEALSAAAEVHAWGERMESCWALSREYRSLVPRGPEPCAAPAVGAMRRAAAAQVGLGPGAWVRGRLELAYLVAADVTLGLRTTDELSAYYWRERDVVEAALRSLRIEPSDVRGLRVAYTRRDGSAAILLDGMTNIVEWTTSEAAVADALRGALFAEVPLLAQTAAAVAAALTGPLPSAAEPRDGESASEFARRCVDRVRDDGTGTFDDRIAQRAAWVVANLEAARLRYLAGVRAMAAQLSQRLPSGLREGRYPEVALAADLVAAALTPANGRTALERFLDDEWSADPALDASVGRCWSVARFGHVDSLEACAAQRFASWLLADVDSGTFQRTLERRLAREVDEAVAHYERAVATRPAEADRLRDAVRAWARERASTPGAWYVLGKVEAEGAAPDVAAAVQAFRTYLRLAPRGAKASEARRFVAQHASVETRDMFE